MIVLVVDSVERYAFFKRLSESDPAAFIILTTEPLAYLNARISGLSCVLVSRKVNRNASIRPLAEKAIECLNGRRSPSQCENDICAVHEGLMRIKDQVRKVVVWNGQHSVGIGVKYFCESQNVSAQFIELSNLPNKLFSDPQGVNAASSLYNNPSLLDVFPRVGDDEHAEWVTEYRKSKIGVLPQSVHSTKKKMNSFLNAALKMLYPAANKGGVAALYGKSLKGGGVRVDFEIVFFEDDYVFFPLQVSADTQLKLHSDIDNIQALFSAAEEAEKIGGKLVVKIHPAETDPGQIREIVKLKARLGFIITDQPTVDLIENAKLVITINSTVGLEAMVLGKPVVVLGRALYQNFNAERLKKYIHHYLVDGVDYFGVEPISKERALRVIGDEIF